MGRGAPSLISRLLSAEFCGVRGTCEESQTEALQQHATNQEETSYYHVIRSPTEGWESGKELCRQVYGAKRKTLGIDNGCKGWRAVCAERMLNDNLRRRPSIFVLFGQLLVHLYFLPAATLRVSQPWGIFTPATAHINASWYGSLGYAAASI